MDTTGIHLMMLTLPSLIELCGVHLTDYKVHLASRGDGPIGALDAFLESAERFGEWQNEQARKNFPCEHIVSLIQIGATRWLFAGAWRVNGVSPHPVTTGRWLYQTTEVTGLGSLSGRAIIHFNRDGVRSSYRRSDDISGKLILSELLPERMSLGDFPGFAGLRLQFAQLKVLVQHTPSSWMKPLQSVSGIYVIADAQSGKLYVGSAHGEGGIWARWCDYAKTGHGGNTELRSLLLTEGGLDRAYRFSYAILEIADLLTTGEEVLRRESHWKDVLQTRSFGLNAN